MNTKKKKHEEHENVERWMVSYADFVTLLFCFFTAMYAISNVDTDKLGKFVKSMRFAFNATEVSGKTFAVIEDVPLVLPADPEVESAVREKLEGLAQRSQGGIEIKRDRRGITISVLDKLFFESGSADLRTDSQDVLDAIAKTLNTFPNIIRIEGHTDNIPIRNNAFSSNWELSSSRAIQVAKYFIDAHSVKPGRIAALGYAEYKPVAPNDTPQGRGKNRRVDIVILNEEEGGREPQ
ncbi:MAG: chemotaxis protein MotB [Nitrospiraceae bacterium]|nr:MAG: chemotaxis protein MotB [Nitrospiraceae bacterium]